MPLAERLARGLKAVLAARILGRAADGLLIILLTRYLLNPESWGLLSLALSVFAVARLFTDLGLAKSAARYVTEYQEKDPSQIPHILLSTLKYNAVTIAVVGLAIGLGSGLIASYMDEPDLVPLLVVGVGYVAFRSLNTYVNLLFQGFNRVSWTAVTRLALSGAQLLFIPAFVLLGFGAVGALAGYVVAFGVTAVVGFAVLYLRFYRTYDKADAPEDGLSRRIAEYSIPLTATRGANVLDKQIDTLLVGFFINPVAVGFYALGKQVTNFLMVPATALGFTISPTYGEQKAADELDRAARLYETTLLHTLLLYIPAATGVILVAEPGIRYVFGADYLGAVPVLQILSGYVVLQSITFITSDGLDYLGRARSRAIAKGTTSGANFLLNLALIPLYGIAGAAAATVATHTVYVLVNLAIVHGEFSLNLRRIAKNLVIICAITVGMAVIVVAAKAYITNIFTLVGVVLLGTVVWGVLSVLSGLLDVRRVTSILA